MSAPSLTFPRVSLLDTGFAERLSYPAGLERPDRWHNQRASQFLRHPDIQFRDFFRDQRSGRVSLGLLVPILDPHDSARVIGIVSLRIDPEHYLYPLLSRWPTPSRTGEILLIRREGAEVVYLNDLRFQDSTALALRRPLATRALPAAAAVLGQEGIMEGVDYRGVPVLASLHSVPGSPWALVAKIHLTEVYEPLRERMWTTVFLCVVLLACAAAGVGMVWRQQRARFYREKYRAILERSWLLDIIARSLNEIYAFDPPTLRCRFMNAGAFSRLPPGPGR